MAGALKAAELAAVAAQITTIGRARAVLGKVTEILHEGYEKIDGIGSGSANVLFNSGILNTPIDELRDSARAELDIVRAYAEGIYATIGTSDPDLQEEEISAVNAARVGMVMARAQNALESIEDAAHETYWDLSGALRDVLTNVGDTAGSAVQSVTNSVAAGASAFVSAAWPTLLVGTAVIVGVLLWRSGAIKVPGVPA